jgi:hypothetical protein
MRWEVTNWGAIAIIEDGSRVKPGMTFGHRRIGDTQLVCSERIWLFNQTTIGKHQLVGQLRIA